MKQGGGGGCGFGLEKGGRGNKKNTNVSEATYPGVCT